MRICQHSKLQLKVTERSDYLRPQSGSFTVVSVLLLWLQLIEQNLPQACNVLLRSIVLHIFLVAVLSLVISPIPQQSFTAANQEFRP